VSHDIYGKLLMRRGDVEHRTRQLFASPASPRWVSGPGARLLISLLAGQNQNVAFLATLRHRHGSASSEPAGAALGTIYWRQGHRHRESFGGHGQRPVRRPPS
jgi:hypothetical protein